jgi:hydroxysqualene dehydroxylase
MSNGSASGGSPHIVIVGGGWAGISAAIEAVQRGARVTIVEARGYWGGRARSFEAQRGYAVDNGQHVLMGCYSRVRQILRTIGTHDLIHWHSGLYVPFVHVGGVRGVLDSTVAPGALGLIIGMLRMQHIPLRERCLIVTAALRIIVIQPKHFETCLQWLQRNNQNHIAITNFWEPLILATLNAQCSQAPAQLLYTVLRLALFGKSIQGIPSSALGIPTVGLSTLVEPFVQWMPPHCSTLLHTKALRLQQAEQSTVTGVWVEQNGSETCIECDAVVLAIPQRALRNFGMPQEQCMEMSAIVSVYLWYSTNWCTEPVTAMLGGHIQWVFQKPNGCVALTISAATFESTMNKEQLMTLCNNELIVAFPECANSTLVNGLVIKEQHATPLFTPETIRHRIANGTLGKGLTNVAFAGDWVDTGLPATLEGAARSGKKAVQDVLEHLNVR